MSNNGIDRRSFLTGVTTTGTALAAGLSTGCVTGGASNAQTASATRRWQNGRSPWPICLDTATIRPASLTEKIDIAAKAGFDAIEPWEREVHEYEQSGGSLKELGKQIRDRGLFVPSVIGLWNAIPPTQEAWEKSLVDSRRRMRQASELGAEHIQVVPQPARPWTEFNPRWAADRYRDLLEIGLNDYNINPAMVFVEFLEGAKTMGKAAQIAMDADHPKAKIIPDVFHMHIGGSGFHSLKHIQGSFIAIFQFNDAPASPPKDELKDKHRVFPGDGILPLTDILEDLKATGYTDCVSLELYNPEYHQRNLLDVAQEGLTKTLKVIEQAGV